MSRQTALSPSASSAPLQTTLANRVSCSGIGLHSGSRVHMSIYPAIAGTGIVFKRLDMPSAQALIHARFDHVCETRLGTTLRNHHGVTVSTVEHLMAAFWGVGIDNAVVELDGPEVPIMDGSSEPFVFLLECARIVQLSEPRKLLRVLKTVEVTEKGRDGDCIARAEPVMEGDEGCTIQIEIQFNNKVIDRQASYYDFRETNFKQSLSRARTFGFEHEVAAMRASGLALGGSLDNAIVVGKDGVLNAEGLRYQDEFVRHKALDCIGDLYLAGFRMDAHFTFLRPGHAINNKLLRAIFADKHAYQIVSTPHLEVPLPFVNPSVAAYA